jgi:drug/metabolite transporter (DMT)-like permease
MDRIISFLLTSLCYSIMRVGFVLSLEYTAVGNAVILCNSQSLLLLAGNMFVGNPVSSVEAIGALVAFCGAIFCFIDSSQSAPVSAGGKTFLGDCLGIVSSIGGVGYLIFAKQTRSHMNLYVFIRTVDTRSEAKYVHTVQYRHLKCETKSTIMKAQRLLRHNLVVYEQILL